MNEGPDPRSIAIQAIQRELDDVKADLQGDPARRRKGLWEKVELIEQDVKQLKTHTESQVESLQQQLEAERVQKRIEKTYRRAFATILTGLMGMSGLLLWLVNKVLSVLATGA